jgi:glutaminyl-tRNA synthetase
MTHECRRSLCCAEEVIRRQRVVIDREDFRESANKHFKRLVIGKRVRLRGALVIEAERCDTDVEGNVTQVFARCVTLEQGSDPDDGIKPKGVIHWVSADHCVPARVRCYDRLFSEEAPGRCSDIMEAVNPESLVVIEEAMIEPMLATVAPEQAYQFEREGYFVADRYEHQSEAPVFNMTIGLRDNWSASNG